MVAAKYRVEPWLESCAENYIKEHAINMLIDTKSNRPDFARIGAQANLC